MISARSHLHADWFWGVAAPAWLTPPALYCYRSQLQ
jgi:hypothetical protein